MMIVDGRRIPISEVLQDPSLASMISYEGSIKNIRYATEEHGQGKDGRPDVKSQLQLAELHFPEV